MQEFPPVPSLDCAFNHATVGMIDIQIVVAPVWHFSSPLKNGVETYPVVITPTAGVSLDKSS